ncbi:GspH/FimT family pseudopilin [Brevundimonas sp. VNH65]|uniref:GspH/FimT family pseudopilin n=1 Tax=Brevundimonas sp. VNH65 TaxID=3400917 RepID=UPI003C002AD6
MTPTSATGKARGSEGRRRRSGFTLVELMVTVAVIGLAAGAVVMTAMPSQPSAVRTAERFAARLAEARSEAILSNRPVSATVDQAGYRFSILQGRDWVAAGRPLTGQAWEEGVTSSGPAERWTFDPTGAVEPASRSISREGVTAVVRIDEAGQVRVEGATAGDG